MADVLISSQLPKGRKQLGLQTPGFDASISGANAFKESVQHPDIALGTIAEYENGDQYMYVKIATDIDASGAAVPVKLDLVTYIASFTGAAGLMDGAIEVGPTVDGTPAAKYGWIKTAGRVVDLQSGTAFTAGQPVAYMTDGSGFAIVPPDAVTGNGAGEQQVRGKAIAAADTAPTPDETDVWLFKIF